MIIDRDSVNFVQAIKVECLNVECLSFVMISPSIYNTQDDVVVGEAGRGRCMNGPGN